MEVVKIDLFLKLSLSKCGVETERAISHFKSNANEYQKFLFAFSESDILQKIIASYNKMDYEFCLRNVREYAQLCNNLGLDMVSELCKKVIKHMEENNFKACAELLSEMNAIFQKLCDEIEKAKRREHMHVPVLQIR